MIFGFIVLVLSLFFSPSAWAAWAEVGGQAYTAIGDGIDTQGADFPSPVVSGNLIVAIGSAWVSGGAPPTVTVTSTCSDPLTVKSSAANAQTRDYIAYGPATSSAACTVTVDPDGLSASIAFAINEFSGGGTLDVDNVSGDFESVGNTYAHEDIVTGVSGALILGVVSRTADSAYDSLTPDLHYTEIGENEDNINHQAFGAVFRIAGAPSTYTVGWTWGNNVKWSTHIMSLAPTVAAGAGKKRTVIVQ